MNIWAKYVMINCKGCGQEKYKIFDYLKHSFAQMFVINKNLVKIELIDKFHKRTFLFKRNDVPWKIRRLARLSRNELRNLLEEKRGSP